MADLLVDDTCIDCDLCRQLAPETFARSERLGRSYVHAEPPAARQRALQALVTCPTASIKMTRKLDARAAARAFPLLVDGLPDVMFCGYASADSYGASSWLVRRPDGNVLVDSPRAARVLMDRVAQLGGVRWMFLTHRDDVADHQAWRDRFGCERVIHRADVCADTRGVERILEGETALAGDLLAIPVPGHTRGSMALLYRADVLFSGDHLWANAHEDGLEAGADVCWHSWPEQRRSVAKLADHTFTWVLPGHGRRWHAPDATAMQAELRRVAESM